MAASGIRLILCLACMGGMSIAGCRTVEPPPAPEYVRTGEVGMEIVPPPPGAAHMQLPQSQRFVFPNLEAPVVMPVYPASLLRARLAPVLLCVEADIGADGRVMAARSRVDAGCANGPVRQEFVSAVTEAVLQWIFAPALLCKAPDTRFDDPCLHPQMTESPTSVRLSYAFRFSQNAGKPTVEQVGAE